jgi:K+-transporting ATPase ATPase A chain
VTANGWLQILFFSLCILAIAKPLGIYLVRVFDGSVRWLRPVERIIYRACGVDPDEDQHWTRAPSAMLLFSLASMPSRTSRCGFSTCCRSIRRFGA